MKNCTYIDVLEEGDHNQSMTTDCQGVEERDCVSDYSVYTFIFIIIEVILYSIGCWICIKVVLVSRKEKLWSWQLHVMHSVTLIIHFGSAIIFHNVTQFVPCLHRYTGTWLCYVVFIVFCYGVNSIQPFTLMVAMMKYLRIVHRAKCTQFGEEKVAKIFVSITFLYPFLLAIWNVITSDYDLIAPVVSCFGQSAKEVPEKLNMTYVDTVLSYFMCGVEHEATGNGGMSHDNSLHQMKQVICVASNIMGLVIASNVFEGLCYYKIFKFVQR